MKEKLIEVKNLTITFLNSQGSHVAVRGLHFDVFKGEVLGIIGESGSGKTATAMALLKLYENTHNVSVEGEILFALPGGSTVNIESEGDKSMQSIRGNFMSMVFQEPMTSLNPIMTCGLQVAETLTLHQNLSLKEAKVKTLAIFESVGLPNASRTYDAYPHAISGGQRQRVLISMAICTQPSLLIADEPATALDYISQKAIVQLFRKFNQNAGMSIILISHDLGIVSELADRVLVFHRGEIVEQGRTADVLGKPVHPFTKGLLACMPVLSRKPQSFHSKSDLLSSNDKADDHQPLSQKMPSTAHFAQFSHPEFLPPVAIGALIQVENLQVQFTKSATSLWHADVEHIALHDVNLKIQHGEIVGVIGTSGAGKTTLAKVLMGLQVPTAGKVLFSGEDINNMKGLEKLRFRKNVQLVFQDPYSSLNPAFTIEDSLIEPMKLHKLYSGAHERRRKAIFLLETVGLDQTALEKFPEQFSGGQRQRIAFARALASEPQLLICDESISSLDFSIQAQILDLLKELRNKINLACIFISHDLGAVNYLCDSVIVLQDGKVAESGPVEVVFNNPQSPYIRDLPLYAFGKK